jgi:hypothetical protein
MSKVRIRLINGERWYSAIDLGGQAVANKGKGLGAAPHYWIKRKCAPDKYKVIIGNHTASKGMIYIHESKVMEWLVYTEQRKRTVDIRKTHSVAAKARIAGIAMIED